MNAVPSHPALMHRQPPRCKLCSFIVRCAVHTLRMRTHLRPNFNDCAQITTQRRAISRHPSVHASRQVALSETDRCAKKHIRCLNTTVTEGYPRATLITHIVARLHTVALVQLQDPASSQSSTTSCKPSTPKTRSTRRSRQTKCICMMSH